MVVGRLLTYWEGNFSGARLNFGGVYIQYHPYTQASDVLEEKSKSEGTEFYSASPLGGPKAEETLQTSEKTMRFLYCGPFLFKCVDGFHQGKNEGDMWGNLVLYEWAWALSNPCLSLIAIIADGDSSSCRKLLRFCPQLLPNSWRSIGSCWCSFWDNKWRHFLFPIFFRATLVFSPQKIYQKTDQNQSGPSLQDFRPK